MENRKQYCLRKSKEMLEAAEHWLASGLSAPWSKEIARSYLDLYLDLAISYLEQARMSNKDWDIAISWLEQAQNMSNKDWDAARKYTAAARSAEEEEEEEEK